MTTSWVIVDRETGKAVFETYNKLTAKAVNQAKFEVVPILEWLQRVNRTIKERKTCPD